MLRDIRRVVTECSGLSTFGQSAETLSNEFVCAGMNLHKRTEAKNRFGLTLRELKGSMGTNYAGINTSFSPHACYAQ